MRDGEPPIEQVIEQDLLTRLDPSLAKSGIAADRSLIGSGLIDSYLVVEIVEFLEERFAIRLDPEDLTGENFDTICAMAALVRARMGG